MRVLVTGADGFIGKNLTVRLSELDGVKVLSFVRGDSLETLEDLVAIADVVVHLAGENRPENPDDYEKVNVGLTLSLCSFLENAKTKIPVIFSSSAQAGSNNLYGVSKLSAELALTNSANSVGNSLSIYRLPGVFGKWCRPNYNSVVATFCHNIANGLPVNVRDSAIQLELVYIDDVVSAMIDCIFHKHETGVNFKVVAQQYQISLGDLKSKIEAFRNSRTSLVTENVGTGFTRALYSTYVSYLSKEQFSYSIPSHGDERGVFVEMLKTLDSGQLSFFTAHPGITRGGHYHHSKTEKFLVIKGVANFSFRHILTDAAHTLVTSSENPTVVETVPGWAHDITNIGDEDLIVMLWANEIFNITQPDTITYEI